MKAHTAFKKFRAMVKARANADALGEALSKALTEHVGFEVFVSYDNGDGWLIVEHDNSAQTQVWDDDIEHLLSVTSTEAADWIRERRFN